MRNATTAGATSTRRFLFGIVALAGLVLIATRFGSVAEATEAAASTPPLEPEQISVASLPPVGDHWLWVPDRLLGHSLLFDGDSGKVLGMIDSPLQLTPQPPMISKERGELYSVDIAYARALRGDRVDFLTIYDLTTLEYKDEIVYPTKSATANTSIAYSSRIGERFVGVFNQFPAQSVSILDLDERRFVGEVGISGCAGLYEIDSLRFATLCGDGTATVIELTRDGRLSKLVRSEKFFDTIDDPIFTSAGRIGTRWIFVSFAGQVHSIEFAGAKPVASSPWSLLGDQEGRSDWRPGGLQLVAVHAASERLFVVMHEVGPDSKGTHKDSGPEIWSFDLESQERIDRIEPPPLAATFLGGTLGLEPDSFARTVLEWVLPADEVHSIAVSQDDAPLLFMRNAELGAVGVVRADDGSVERVLGEAGLFGPTLRVP